MQRSALCRSRRELSNTYLLAKIGVDTAEIEPLEVWGENSIHYSLHSLGLGSGTLHDAAEYQVPQTEPFHAASRDRGSRAAFRGWAVWARWISAGQRQGVWFI